MAIQILKDLPEISSLFVDGDLIELELEERVEFPEELRGERIVFIANSYGQITVIVGHVVEHENIEGGIPEIFCQMKIKGSIVEFNTI